VQLAIPTKKPGRDGALSELRSLRVHTQHSSETSLEKNWGVLDPQPGFDRPRNGLKTRNEYAAILLKREVYESSLIREIPRPATVTVAIVCKFKDGFAADDSRRHFTAPNPKGFSEKLPIVSFGLIVHGIKQSAVIVQGRATRRGRFCIIGSSLYIPETLQHSEKNLKACAAPEPPQVRLDLAIE
jgi:hypothetical protein